MTFLEKRQDLFQGTDDYYYVHCISGDFALGAGIAVEFNKRFDMRNQLKKRLPNYYRNEAILIGRVFNLVTKRRYFDKPTYLSLTAALYSLRYQVRALGIKKLAMPRIGCGLDRLSWNKVSDIIKTVFGNMDVEILVCYL